MTTPVKVLELKRRLTLANTQLQAVSRGNADPSVMARYNRAAQHWDRMYSQRIDILNRRVPLDKRPNWQGKK